MAEVAPAPPVAELGIGSVVALRTCLGEDILSATVFANDATTGCMLLREPGAHNGVVTLRFLRTACVAEVLSCSSPPPGAPHALDHANLPVVCLEKSRRREQRALAAAGQEAARVGDGVTKEAQMVFDALVRTMPCRWQGKSILVLEEVRVDEPYTAEAASADGEHSHTLRRVQKVLHAERQRLGI